MTQPRSHTGLIICLVMISVLSGCSMFQNKLVAVCTKGVSGDKVATIEFPSTWWYGVTFGKITVPGDVCYYSMPMLAEPGQTAVPLGHLPDQLPILSPKEE